MAAFVFGEYFKSGSNFNLRCFTVEIPCSYANGSVFGKGFRIPEASFCRARLTY